MGLFSKKREFTVAECCQDFYDNVVNASIAGFDADTKFYEITKQKIEETDPKFSKVDPKKFNDEFKAIQYEIFSLAWTHKNIEKNIIPLTEFTKNYLKELGQDKIWDRIADYNNAIDGATLHWLSNLGRMNLTFWYGVREDLSKLGEIEAKKLGITDEEVVKRANQRLCSEKAWEQKIIIGPLVFTLCEALGIDARELSQEARFRLASVIFGLYLGARQYLDKIKIVDEVVKE